METGLLELGVVTLDGPKVRANASKHRALPYGYVCEWEEQLTEEVEGQMDKAE